MSSFSVRKDHPGARRRYIKKLLKSPFPDQKTNHTLGFKKRSLFSEWDDHPDAQRRHIKKLRKVLVFKKRSSFSEWDDHPDARRRYVKKLRKGPFPDQKKKKLRKEEGQGSGKEANGEEAEQLGEKLTRSTKAFQDLMELVPFNPYSHRKFESINEKILTILDEPLQIFDQLEGEGKSRIYFSPIKHCGLLKVVEKVVKKHVLGQLLPELQDYHYLVSKANYIYCILGHLYFITFDLIKDDKVIVTIQACVYCPFDGEGFWNVWNIKSCNYDDVEDNDFSKTIREDEEDEDDGWETESFKAIDAFFPWDPFDHNDPDSIGEFAMVTVNVEDKDESFYVPEAAQIAVDAYNDKMGFQKLKFDCVSGANIAACLGSNSFYITLDAILLSNSEKRTFVTNVLQSVTNDYPDRVRVFRAKQYHSRVKEAAGEKIVQQDYSFLDYAEQMNDGCMKCKFCGHIYARGTSISLFTYHLSGRRRAGVKICETVPKAIQEAACAAINGPSEKNLKTIASSSNNETDNNMISTSLSDCSPTSELELIQMQIEEIELSMTHLQHVETGGLLERFTGGTDGQPAYIKEIDSQSPMTFQPMDLDCQAVERQHLEGGGVLEKFTVDEDGLQHQVSSRICSPSVYNIVLRNDEGTMTREPEQTVVRDGSRESLQHAAGDRAKGVVFPTSKLIGGAFEENKNNIWRWLMDDEVSLVGIYGMGGVGKTTLVKHIHNQLLNMRDKYGDVYWITVSQDFSNYKLQKLIAERIGLDLSDDDDEMHRAAKLSEELARRQNYVLILDDLWIHFEPEEVGIPRKMDGCKLILTTRSLNVCRQMHCEDNMIKVEPLLEEEAWNLFRMELGNFDEIKLEHLAKSVADECDGLPLGIRTMARSMRGVYDEREWRNALEELKESRVRLRDMEPLVFRILRFSYLHLKDSALQQCFLYCALFPEDFIIERMELIELFISEGMIKGRKSRAAAFDKGHEMLNQLVNACLLETATPYDISCVKMHDLVRDMAVQEMREKSDVIVEAGEQLEELPDEEKWTQNIVRVSLMENDVKEIPSSRSPKCPNLLTLLLSGNEDLGSIGDSFFKQMQGLKVLDLSYTAIKELPNSISDLVTLTALLLGNCKQLTHVPSLGKLKALKKLDFHDTALTEVPRGLELLSSLEYLDLKDTSIQEIPAGILPKHCHLQVLRFGLVPFPIMVKAEELACLRKLETLECRFVDLLAFKTYIKELDHDKKTTQLPSIFKCAIGNWEGLVDDDFIEKFDRVINLWDQEINRSCGDAWLLPKGIEALAMGYCSDMKSLCDFYPSQHETELKCLSISNCESMECLVSSSQMSKSMLGTIEDLSLDGLEELRSLFSKQGASPTPLLPGDGIFSHLKTLYISDCPKLETLFPPGLLPNLQNLEKIEVITCDNLEKIISEEESNVSSSDPAIEFSLPKLRIVILEYLPALMSIGCGKLICNSLQQIIIRHCERLKRLPFSCSPRTLKVVGAFPKEWWESVKWDEKNDYTVVFERW